MHKIIRRMYLLSLFSSLIPVQAMDEASMVVERADSKKRTFSEFSYRPLRRVPVELQAPPAKKAKTVEWCDIELAPDNWSYQSFDRGESCDVEDFELCMEEEGHSAHPNSPVLSNHQIRPSIFMQTKNAMLVPFWESFGGGMSSMGCVYPPAW